MPSPKHETFTTDPEALQAAIDASNVIGHWEWNVGTDQVFADALVALLYGVDPRQAEAGVPRAQFVARIHPDDRESIDRRISRCAREGGAYLGEYRVCSADGVTRWILSRGQFTHDVFGKPLRGRGICIDITQSRVSEDAYVLNVLEPAGHSLERAAEHIMAARKALGGDEAEPKLRLLADMLLLEVGRELARAERRVRLKRMN